MAGSPLLGLYNPNSKRKRDYGDTVTPLIASLIGNAIKDTAISSGQIWNEAANARYNPLFGPLAPAAAVGRHFGGNDWLANLVGRVNQGAGESMKGEVTPMDFVNVASLAPIPVGAGARAGLVGLKLAARANRAGGRGAFSLGKTASATRYKPSTAAKIAEATMHNPISANFLNNAPELAFNAPALINTWKSDLSPEAKAGITAATLLGTSAGGITNLAKYKMAQRAAEKGIDPASALVRTEARGSAQTSDIAINIDTDMPPEALVAFTGSQPGYRTRYYAALYENDPRFRSIVDDFNDGKISVDDAHNRTLALTQELPPNMGIGLKRRNWEYWDRHKRTGSFVVDPKDPSTTKLDTLYESITGNPSAVRIPWDTKERQRALSLYKAGFLGPTRITGKTQKERDNALRELYFKWYNENVLLSNNPFTLQARRERLYGASGVSDVNVY